MSAALERPMLLVDCTQRESVLGLAVSDARGGTTVTARRFESAAHAPRERFWDELRALESEVGLDARTPEIGCVAVAIGPGGFTGLRVSIAFAKAIALADGIPAVPVPSALVFAASHGAGAGPHASGPWLVALAAKDSTAWVTRVERGLHLAGFAGLAGPAPRSGLSLGRVVDPVEFAALLGPVVAEGGVLLADGHLDPGFAACAHSAGATQAPLAVDVGAFAAVSRGILAAGGGVRAAELAPIYAREPEAVTKWRARARGTPSS
jgi:tRNA threonylcarbamoyladenosine biosynthesis protein TsaB